MSLPPQVISHHCFVVWSRFDPKGLAEFKAMNGGQLRVRVPVPRQKWPEPTVDGSKQDHTMNVQGSAKDPASLFQTDPKWAAELEAKAEAQAVDQSNDKK